ncbi:COG4315 family predicted lipoprotein [Flavobacterium mesophilum]|uniref:COG4315 family predicted lipoprotein n=1 Tax=Flavobacterium mesophilum TaxID=3143495 RepID=UPI0031E192DD
MKLRPIKFATTILAISAFFLSCSSDNGNDTTTPTPTPTPVTTTEINLSTSATLGSYLSDKSGRSLYFFATDANGQSSCTGGCEAFWPVFFVDNLTTEKLGAGLTLSDFATITTSSGKKQLTYKGWPLYYYAPMSAGDGYGGGGVNTIEAAGKTTGDGVDGTWFIAKPDYSIMIVRSQLVGHDGKNYKPDYTVGDGATTYFTDAKGLTLYTFKSDNFKKNNFTKADFSNNAVWPIYETDKIVVPSILDKSKFSSITVFGKVQLTYNGWPLYYFGQDAGVRGANKGISFPSPGIWPVPVKDIPLAI